jgi:hypothetical protein
VSPSAAAAAAKQMSVEMFPEGPTDTIQCYGVDARVDKAETESYDPKCMPEIVVNLFRLGIKVEPKIKYVIW